MAFVENMKEYLQHWDHICKLQSEGEDGLMEEFKQLKLQSARNKQENKFSTKEGERECNFKKNRYKDILPFDHSRIKLEEIDGVAGSNYINANFIKGPFTERCYIAAQGPLTATVNDFVRLLWESKSTVLIMACNEYELNHKTKVKQLKCERYWADKKDTSKTFDDITVTYVDSSHIIKDVNLRKQKLSKGNQERIIYQYHYTAWPDHGVPDSVGPISDMVRIVRECQPDVHSDIPILIHCSAGCGRTGTICAMDHVWQLLQKQEIPSDFSLYDIITDMRTQRSAMVQTKDQYEFVHRAVAQLFRDKLEELGEDDGDSNYQNVKIRSPSEGPVMPPTRQKPFKSVSAEKSTGKPLTPVLTPTPVLPQPPATSKPATSKPATSKLATSKPATSKPATSKPATSKPKSKVMPRVSTSSAKFSDEGMGYPNTPADAKSVSAKQILDDRKGTNYENVFENIHGEIGSREDLRRISIKPSSALRPPSGSDNKQPPKPARPLISTKLSPMAPPKAYLMPKDRRISDPPPVEKSSPSKSAGDGVYEPVNFSGSPTKKSPLIPFSKELQEQLKKNVTSQNMPVSPSSAVMGVIPSAKTRRPSGPPPRPPPQKHPLTPPGGARAIVKVFPDAIQPFPFVRKNSKRKSFSEKDNAVKSDQDSLPTFQTGSDCSDCIPNPIYECTDSAPPQATHKVGNKKVSSASSPAKLSKDDSDSNCMQFGQVNATYGFDGPLDCLRSVAGKKSSTSASAYEEVPGSSFPQNPSYASVGDFSPSDPSKSPLKKPLVPISSHNGVSASPGPESPPPVPERTAESYNLLNDEPNVNEEKNISPSSCRDTKSTGTGTLRMIGKLGFTKVQDLFDSGIHSSGRKQGNDANNLKPFIPNGIAEFPHRGGRPRGPRVLPPHMH